MMDYGQRLGATPMGSELGAETCADLAALMEPLTVQAGEQLFASGTAPDNLYVVLAGELRVILRPAGHQDDLVLAILGPGGVVGELEVFTQNPHMASVVAAESTTCLRLATRLLREPPARQRAAISALVFELAKVLAMRLAAVNDKLLAAWSLPEAGAADADLSAPGLREVLDDVWRW